MTEMAPERLVPETEPVPKQWRRRVGRFAVSLCGGLLAAAPLAAANGITQTEVKDDVASIPATLALSPGHSSLHLGGFGSLDIASPAFMRYHLGVSVAVDEPPTGLGELGSQQLNDVVRPLVDAYHDPAASFEGDFDALKHAVIENLLRSETVDGGLAALGFYAIIALTGKVPTRERRKIVAAVAGTVLAISSAQSYQLFDAWFEHAQRPATNFNIDGTDNTKLEGLTSTSAVTAQAINRLVPFILQEVKHQDVLNQQFIKNAKQSIDELLRRGDFVPPKKSETLVLMMSDLHSNADMIHVYRYLVDEINRIYGPGTITLMVAAGDQTYGSASEKKFVERFAHLVKGTYAVSGNHDGEITEHNEKAAGVNVLDGHTIEIAPGMRLLGGPDPSLTKLPKLFGIGDNVDRDSSKPFDQTGQIAAEYKAGEKLNKQASTSHPTFLAVHESDELAPMLDTLPQAKKSIAGWVEAGDTAPPTELDVPADISIFGHNHPIKAHVRKLRQSDGTNSVVINLGSAGGASAHGSASNIGTPLTPPVQPATIMFATVDKTGVKSLQEFRTSTDGTTAFGPVVPINP